MKNNCVIFLMGPTAAGKTSFALELKQQINAYLISVDSALIYQGMDIGTAKPDKATLAKHPHALVDIISPDQSYSVANFCTDATALIDQALAQKQIPLLVGGTSFYFKSLAEGLSKLPESSAVVRKQLTKTLTEKGLSFLYQQLQNIDPVSAERINANDSQRILRALEVYTLSAQPMSQLQQQQKVGALTQPLKKIILLPARTILHQRIEARFLQMLDEGLVDEVKQMYQNPLLNADLPAIRAVGYRQVWQYLDGLLSYDEMVNKAIIATRQLCKRQTTWLRAEKDVLVLTAPNLKQTLNYLND